MNERKTTQAIRGTTPGIEQRARELRSSMTPSENVLWQALKGRQLDGLRFRAQHPVGRFILDFYCPEHKLVIEVDGDIHETNPERDKERSAYLAAFGYKVVRLHNAEVLADLPAALNVIRNAVAACQEIQTDSGE